MKSLLIAAVFIFHGISWEALPAKKIQVQVTITIDGQPVFGDKGKVTILRGVEWKDTVGIFPINKDGRFQVKLPDSLLVFYLFINKPECVPVYVPVYPELGNCNFNIRLRHTDSPDIARGERITWSGDNKEAQEAAYKAYFHISGFEKMVTDTLKNLAGNNKAFEIFQGIDLDAELAIVKEKLDRTTDPQARKILLIEYLCVEAVQQKVLLKRDSKKQLFKGKADPIILAQLLHEVPPGSALWAIERNCIRWLVKRLPLSEKLLNYGESVLTEQLNPFIAASVLYGLAQRYKEDSKPDDFSQTMTRLITDYPGQSPANRAKAEFSLFSSIAPGKQVPAFSVPSIDKPGEFITDKTMLGRTYLLEFWALWCTGCIQAIPYLQDAYKKYNSQGFEIVSVYLDKRVEAAKQFREKKFPMPWINAYEPAAFNSTITRNFEISWIPRSVLVGPDGKILAIDLQATELDEKIKAVLTKTRSRP